MSTTTLPPRADLSRLETALRAYQTPNPTIAVTEKKLADVQTRIESYRLLGDPMNDKDLQAHILDLHRVPLLEKLLGSCANAKALRFAAVESERGRLIALASELFSLIRRAKIAIARRGLVEAGTPVHQATSASYNVEPVADVIRRAESITHAVQRMGDEASRLGLALLMLETIPVLELELGAAAKKWGEAIPSDNELNGIR